MANRMSILHPAVEELRHGSPMSSPLRRRSSVAQKMISTDLEENDDEAERIKRRLEKNIPAASRNDKRKSLGISFVGQMSNLQIAEKISQCIKLSAENKINIKNAFSLEMIDFMTYMIKKRDGNMSNLQVASTSLDVSTKIYGFRVDGVHTDILKMIGGMDKQDKNDGKRGNKEGEEEATVDEEEGDVAKTRGKAKKKRKNKIKILVNPDSLRGKVETINPNSLMFTEDDSQTTDLLYQAVLPHHASTGICLHPYNDVLPDKVNSTAELSINSTPMPCPTIDNLTDLDMCQSFANFEFLGWSADDEVESTPEKSQSIHEDFRFDLNASLPPNDEPSNCGVNYFDLEDDCDDENVERCGGPTNQNGLANIVDFREVVQASKHTKHSEYSYFQDNVNIQWAGPSHWKIRYASKNLGGSRIVEGCGQAPVRKKKELLLAYNDDSKVSCDIKFDVARSNQVKLQPKTTKNYWSEDKLTFPQDMHYDALQYCKFYLRPEVLIEFPQRGEEMNATHISDEVSDYNYNNENDTTDYCPNIESNEPATAEGCNNTGTDFDEEFCTPAQAFCGDNCVEAPKMNSKIFIPYSQRAKKIDMKQLKKCIWKNLTFENNMDKENIEENEATVQARLEKMNGTKLFSETFKNLPKTLSKANIEALSFPIAFASLLHIANEKCLKIKSTSDYSDLVIEQA